MTPPPTTPPEPPAADTDEPSRSSFEHDIAAQAGALRDLARAPQSQELAAIAAGPYQRIVLTGMGSSYFAALPSWRRLAAAGLPAWWVDSGQLLETPQLLTATTLMIICSQSGASGEVVALLDHVKHLSTTTAIIGITNNTDSPLGTRADALLNLHSGPEATVSTKSYLNTLLAYEHLTSSLTPTSHTPVDVASDTVEAVENYRRPDGLSTLASDIAERSDARLAFVGFGDQGATALYAGLITKEAAKIPAEGFIGGQFRHGPLELAGPGFTAMLFTSNDPTTEQPLRQLAADLHNSGSTVVSVGPLNLPNTVHVPTWSNSGVPLLAESAITAQHLAVALARADHLEPGEFRYGSKITTTL